MLLPDVITPEDRVAARELQLRADRLRGSTDPTPYSKVVYATGHGWVEVSADYLTALLDRLEEYEVRGGR